MTWTLYGNKKPMYITSELGYMLQKTVEKINAKDNCCLMYS